MKTIRELGRRIKLKTPGAYDDLSDEEVGRLAKAKHPGAYDDYVDEVESSEALVYREETPLVDNRSSQNLQPLIDYYNPSRGRFTSWWETGKSERRNKLLLALNAEQKTLSKVRYLKSLSKRERRAKLNFECLSQRRHTTSWASSIKPC